MECRDDGRPNEKKKDVGLILDSANMDFCSYT